MEEEQNFESWLLAAWQWLILAAKSTWQGLLHTAHAMWQWLSFAATEAMAQPYAPQTAWAALIVAVLVVLNRLFLPCNCVREPRVRISAVSVDADAVQAPTAETTGEVVKISLRLLSVLIRPKVVPSPTDEEQVWFLRAHSHYR